ncbi:hypothetical protein [Sinorhizobium meliloti]
MTNVPKPSKTVIVFNCWQSDLSADTHRNAIRNALRKAAKAIQKKLSGTKIVIDEALRSSSGAPNIAVNVREKIEKADIVVADITTITPIEAERPCPNPNVTFELGLGVATVGWARTVLLFNGSPQKGEVPFDFAQNRVSSFTMTNKSDQPGRAALEKLVERALRDIIEQDPKRPAQERGLSRHEIEHQRDVQMVRWLMEHLHVAAVSEMISMLPKRVLHRHLWFYEHFRGLAVSTSFHVYDDRLAEAVEALRNAWERAFSEGEAYTDMPGGDGYVFSNQVSGGHGDAGSARWDRIEAARLDMLSALDIVLMRVRNNYLEINIEETNKIAWETYRTEMAEIDG